LRKQAEAEVGREITDEEFCSYLMYPKVFVDYARNRAEYGPVAMLPTHTYFYGMTAGDEISVDLEPGKSMVIHCAAIGDTDNEGSARVFFELNDQPRITKVPDRHAEQASNRPPKADEGNPAHVAAPMPGVIATVAVKEGQEVRTGDLLMTIEAMKMETTIHADRNGLVHRLLVSAGSQVDAKDLLLEFET
jgi:pyruvate carboxylase